MDAALDILPPTTGAVASLPTLPKARTASFTWANFQAGVIKDLADVLGNFVSRVDEVRRWKFGEIVPEAGHLRPEEQALIEAGAAKRAHRPYEGGEKPPGGMDAIRVRKSAAALARSGWRQTQYLQAAAPWSVLQAGPGRAAARPRLALKPHSASMRYSRPLSFRRRATHAFAMNTLDTGGRQTCPSP